MTSLIIVLFFTIQGFIMHVGAQTAVLTVTDPVIHGQPFDLNCSVGFTSLGQHIYWYIVEESTDYKIYTLFRNGTGSTGSEHDHLLGRSVNATKISDTLYRLHIEQAVKDKDEAAYRCQKETQIISDITEIVNIYTISTLEDSTEPYTVSWTMEDPTIGGCQGLCTWEIVLIVIGVIALLVCIGGVTYFAISKLKKPRPATTVK